MSRCITCVLLLGIAVTFAAQYESVGQTKKKPIAVSVEDIGDSVILIGRLGKPLGTKMKIRGRWSMPESDVKDYSPRFTVTHIDGKQTDKPIEFNIGQIDAMTPDRPAKPNESVPYHNAIPEFKDWRSLEGQEWTMIAYESGSIHMAPDEYDEQEQVFPVVQVPYYTRPLTSEIVAVLTSKESAVQK